MTRPPRPASSLAPRFAALRTRDYRRYFVASLVGMTGENIEHVISYWVPFLLFSVYTGGLADRHDCRRLIQVAQALFMLASAAWGLLFLTGTLQMWHAVVILLVHGVAGVIGAPAVQLIIHDMVGAAQLQSAVRLNATSRYLSILLGPAVGGGLMVLLGPAGGLVANVLIYAPLTILDRRIVTMIVLGGATSFFVGNAFQNAAGAVLGAVLLESLNVLRPGARTAIVCAGAWGVTIGLFPAARGYGVAVTLLVLAGVFNIVFMSTAQTLVQILAPPRLRGRIVGLFNTAILGLRAGSGVTVGVLGALIDVRWSLALSAVGVVVTAVVLLVRETHSRDAGRPRP